MLHFELSEIAPKEFEGNVIFLYGNDVSDRKLPLTKKELDYLKSHSENDPEAVVVFDRLPYHLYVVCFDGEKPAQVSQEHLRKNAAKVVDMIKKECLGEECCDTALTGEGVIPEEIVAFMEGMWLADYSFDRYKTKEPKHVGKVYVESNFLSKEDLDSNVRLWNRIYWCREWVNMPVADLNAEKFASELDDIAKDLKVDCTVFDKKKIEELGMGGLLAVNQGSVDEPRFVVMEYKPRHAVNTKPLALVGKGVMYDTGGLNIKTGDYMSEMKSDMAGAATMASVLFAAAENELPVHVVALLPLTDSRPGFNAYAPDDVLTMYDGTTVEVVNTDAEGRLILADAIAYAVRNYSPELVVDAATLTGAAVRAIGTYGIAAMQQHAENPFQLLRIIGEQVHERVVEFPFWDDYDEHVKSDFADLKNCGPGQAGTITAGKFLAHFAKETPYIHLDIAGVAYFSKKQWYYAPGASGFGIRLLYAFIQMYEGASKGKM